MDSHRSPRLARTLALVGPLALVLACADDAGSTGSGGGGGATATGTPAGSTGTNTAGTGTDSAGITSSGTGTSAGGSGGAGVGGAGSGAGATTSTGSGVPTEIAECQGHIYECGDLVDNDQDGLLDSQDPDCLGPCDDTEDSYFGGIPGQAGPPCKVDCYFDQDSGPGNDDCYWSHECDPLSVDPLYYPEPATGDACEYTGGDTNIPPAGTCDELYEEQSQECMDYCGPLTPNGCDCFGCCELPAGSGSFVWLGSEGVDGDVPTVCTQAEIDNPAVCHPCTPVAACLNTCEECEVCIGKPTLPPECFGGEGGGGQGGAGSGPTGATVTGTGVTSTGQGGSTGAGNPDQCPGGEQACGQAGQQPCGAGFYCLTGCCHEVPN